MVWREAVRYAMRVNKTGIRIAKTRIGVRITMRGEGKVCLL